MLHVDTTSLGHGRAELWVHATDAGATWGVFVFRNNGVTRYTGMTEGAARELLGALKDGV